jgi:hypothetical protein
MSYTIRTSQLKENVEYIETETGGFKYIIPSEMDDFQDIVYTAFDSLRRGMWCLDVLATTTETSEYRSPFVYASRRFRRIYKQAYETETEQRTEDYKWVTDGVFGEISDNLNFYNFDCTIQPMTFTLKKTNTSLQLLYTPKFTATEETMDIPFTESDELKKKQLRTCSKSVKYRHAPYNPSFLNEWRYSPSEFSFSIQTEGDRFIVGLANEPPKEPYWHKIYSLFSVIYPLHPEISFSTSENKL